MRSPAWILVLGLGLAELACTAPAKGVARPGSAPRIVPTAVADSVFTGVRLPPPMVDQLVHNDIFDAAGVMRPGTDTTLSFALPVTSEMAAELQGQGVRWSFRAPDGSKISPGESANTDDYVSNVPGDLPGFWLRHPASGVWRVEVEATSRDSAAAYMISVRVDENLPRNAHLETMVRSALPVESNVARPGDVVFVRTFMTDGSKLVTGTLWNVRATTPDTSVMTIPVYDDGHHSDGQRGDGMFVGAFRVEHKEGVYLIRAIGQGSDGVTFFVHDAVAVRDESHPNGR